MRASSPLARWRVVVNAIVVPSGDQAGSRSPWLVAVVVVSRVTVPPPVAVTPTV
jgi:hypothetical protein